MNLLLCLAATALASICQAARIPRGVADFPNFHAVDHGYSATSYQNVQIENYGSVPIPTDDHYHYHHLAHEEPFVIHIIEGTSQDEHADHNISLIHPVSAIDRHKNLQQLIVLEKDHDRGMPFVTGNHEDIRHFITLDEVPHVDSQIQRNELHNVPYFSFYHGKYHPQLLQ